MKIILLQKVYKEKIWEETNIFMKKWCNVKGVANGLKKVILTYMALVYVVRFWMKGQNLNTKCFANYIYGGTKIIEKTKLKGVNMINLIGILSLIVIEAILFMSVIVYFKNKINSIDEEILSRDKTLGEKTEEIKQKNLIIDQKNAEIEELKNEIKEIRREYSQRLRKDS